MSVTTAQQFNTDKFGEALPAGASYSWTGAPFESTGQKTLAGNGCTDAELQAAIDTAAAVFVDYASNKNTILAQAKPALNSNKAYLAIQSPTNAQASAQINALTRQMNALIRLVISDYTLTD